MAFHLYTYEDPVSEKDISRIVSCLDNDGVIAIPSDVNWTLAVKATSKKGLDKLMKLKPNHPSSRPLSLMFKDISHVSEYAQVDNYCYRVLKKVIPGPYTVILPRAKSLPKQLDDKRKEVGIRVPDRELIHAVIFALGQPLAVSTLDPMADGEYAKFGYEIDSYLGHALDMIVDLGEEKIHEETTVFELADGEINVIREGVGDITSL